MKFPMTGYISVLPDKRIVKVKIDNTGKSQFFPYQITALDIGFIFGSTGTNKMCVGNISNLTLHPSRQKAFKSELEKFHKAYCEAKKARREAEQKEKWANKRVFEFKNYERILSFCPTA